MKTRNQLISSLLVGTTLLGGGLIAGLTSGQSMLSARADNGPAAGGTGSASWKQPAGPKISNKFKGTVYVNGKARKIDFNFKMTDPLSLKENPEIYAWIKSPTLKGYKTRPMFLENCYNFGSGYNWMYDFPLNYYKLKNTTNKHKVITVTDNISAFSNTSDFTNIKLQQIKVRGKGWSIKTIAAPKIKGYKSNVAKIQIGIQPNSKHQSAGFDTLTKLTYTKIKTYGYKVSKLKATRSKKSSSVKVIGQVAVSSQSKAKAHQAKYVVISDNKGKTNVKLSKKGTFNKTLKKRNSTKNVKVAAAYRTKNIKKNNGKTTYTYHLISAKKNATVKVTK
ncbi:hypothetical protein [Lactiplantibacillus carotarum]|uniref:hypothetical protein n=1 Tax=Lactiplantibacillus carotarum TaxID=2993456 RepID=UPI00298F2949|nr:hypothetical protein [Lactiplantibacillus carotarum]